MKSFSKKYKYSFENEVFDLWENDNNQNKKISKKKVVAEDKSFWFMPPMSLVSGLHMGHALSLVIQDAVVRYLNMKGQKVKILPLFHHSSFLLYMTLHKNFEESKRKNVDKDDFLEYMFKYFLDQQGVLNKEIKDLGVLCDWSKQAFTMSEYYTRYVRKIFGILYNKGLIYKDVENTYWNSKYCTIVGENDISFVKKKKKKYCIRYFIDTKKDSLLISTFRPDTIFADVALAVNPLDKRYKKLIGKKVIIPIVNRPIPIIADALVDMTKYEGVIRVTPGHDKLSLSLAKSHGLSVDKFAFDELGVFTDLAGIFAGKRADEFFDNIVQYLDDISNMDMVVDSEVELPFCNKTGVQLESLSMEQRFLKISENAKDRFKESLDFNELNITPNSTKQNMSKLLTDSCCWCISRQHASGQPIPFWYNESGEPFVFSEELLKDFIDKKNKEKKGSFILSFIVLNLILDGRIDYKFDVESLVGVLFSQSLVNGGLVLQSYLDIYKEEFGAKGFDKEFEKILGIIEKLDTNIKKADDLIVELESILNDSICIASEDTGYVFELNKLVGVKNNVWKKDGSIFDSFFSCLLSFLYLSEVSDSTGIKMFPMIYTGYDDLQFIFRMLLLNIEVDRKLIGANVNFHSMIVDKVGTEMGFVENNTISPDELIKEYGADALRLSLIMDCPDSEKFAYTKDTIVYYDKVINKLWNICRYIIVSGVGVFPCADSRFNLKLIKEDVEANMSELGHFDVWMLYVINDIFGDYDDFYLKTNNIVELGRKLMKLITQYFGERYLEIVKVNKTDYTQKVLLLCMGFILKLLHPYIPFITEKIRSLSFEGVLLDDTQSFDIKLSPKNYKIHLLMDIVDKLFALKNSIGSKQHEFVDVFIKASPDFLDSLKQHEEILTKIIKIQQIDYLKPQEKEGVGYEQDNVIDIIMGVKKFASKSKKDSLVDIKKVIEQKKDMLQYIRTIISSANANGQSAVIERKVNEMEKIKKEIDDMEYELSKMKIRD